MSWLYTSFDEYTATEGFLFIIVSGLIAYLVIKVCLRAFFD